MRLEFSVNKQIIKRTDENEVVANSKNYLSCQFSFCDDWNDITKTAIFTSAKGDIFNAILENDACIVPWEVIEYPHFTVSVFGGDLITVNRVVIPTTKSGYAKGKTPSNPTPDVYQQILNSVKTPYIGDNGNWYIWDIENRAFVDSGYKAQGDTPEMGVDYFTPKDKAEITEYIDKQTEIIKSDVEGLQKQINEEAHFRGYLSTNAKIQELEATPNDFAYSAESNTKWVYGEVDGWQDTGVPVPDQLTPASETTPLINGEASAGTENAYARGDHRHPTDTTRASVTALNTKADKPIIKIIDAIAFGLDFLLNNNHIIRLGTLHAMGFNFSNGEYPEDYGLDLSFDSGATPTTISYSASGIINWVGVDCTTSDGLSIFQPSPNTHYDIVFYYNGNQFIGLVNGYVPASGNVVSE